MSAWSPAVDEMSLWDTTETADHIQSGDVSPAQVVTAAIERAEAAAPLNAVVSEAYQRALTSAGDSTGPLAGVPTFVKDLSNLSDVPTGFGSRALVDYVPDFNGAFVDLLIGTGLVALGKSSAPEFGLTGTTEPLSNGPTRNPWNLDRSVGGSSGGSAALVAARVVPIASGDDGGGSIRVPAAMNGIVGLKPSRGRYADELGDQLPINILAPGVLTRSVRDQALFHSLVDAFEGKADMPRIGEVEHPIDRRVRVGAFTDNPVRPPDPAVVSAVRKTGDLLSDLGHAVDEVPSIIDQRFIEDFLTYWSFLAFMIRWTSRITIDRRFNGRQLEPWTHGLARYFRKRLFGFRSTLRRLREFAGGYHRLMSDWDVILSPTTTTAAPDIGHLAPDLPFETHLERVTAFMPYTPAWNASGAPGISLPLGIADDGMPVGVHLGGRFGDEATLLALSMQLEQAATFTLI